MKLEAGKQYSIMMNVNILKDIDEEELSKIISFDVYDIGFAEVTGVTNVCLCSEVKTVENTLTLSLSDESNEKYGNIFKRIVDIVIKHYRKEFSNISVIIEDSDTEGVYCGFGDDEGVMKCTISTTGTRKAIIDNLCFCLAIIIHKVRHGNADDIVEQMGKLNSKLNKVYTWIKSQSME